MVNFARPGGQTAALPLTTSARRILLERLASLAERGATWTSPRGVLCRVERHHLEVLDYAGRRQGPIGTFMPYGEVSSLLDLEKILKEATVPPAAMPVPSESFKRHQEPPYHSRAVASLPEALPQERPTNANPGDEPWWVEENPNDPPPF